jgi:acetoacetyl-CoA synthetase
MVKEHTIISRNRLMTGDDAHPIWTPSAERARHTQIYRFMQRVNLKYRMSLNSYPGLWEWSVREIDSFWAEMWDLIGVKASARYTQVIDDPKKMPGAKWFSGAKLNFAENLLARGNDDDPAIIFRGEGMTKSRTMTFAQLRADVADVAAALRERGIAPGDRVVGFMPNVPETIVAMLAASSLGAIWSSCSPDFGVKGVLDRFARLEPKVLFCADGYQYNGRRFDSIGKVAGIFENLTSCPNVVVVPYTQERADFSSLPNAEHYVDFKARGGRGGARDTTHDMIFEQLPFEHPLYIMFSSGTTGLPKCIVQSAGGILLNQLKEHILHVDTRSGDRVFYFTTCGWMMWNWLVAALGTGATVVLYDGAPMYPDGRSLWTFAEEEAVSVFGTSAKYLAALEKTGVKPREECELTQLRAVLSTGSPLSEESFDFVYSDIKSDVCLSSISGGTDLNGCFAGGNPMGPVYRGELQCRQLAMDVHAFDERGRPVIGEKGELVCLSAFPSMPIYFWADPDGSKYHEAYFSEYPGIWRHGDFIGINERGGVKIYGRSDATLNPGGVRIGTAEIYRQVETLPEIIDSLVIGQEWDGDDLRVILFIKMREDVALNDELEARIRKHIRENCSPRHVPAKIISVADIPYTISGKKVELAVRNIIHGRDVRNKDALANPQSLALYENLEALKS